MNLNKHILITGKITEPHPTTPGTYVTVVYQRVGPGLGQRKYSTTHDLQRRAWVRTPNNPTPYQIALRARLAAASAAWSLTTPSERQQIELRAQINRLPTYNQYIKEYCDLHPIDKTAYTPRATTIARPGPYAITPNPTTLDADQFPLASLSIKS